MALSVQNVYGLLIRSRLLPRDALQAMLARWQTEANDAADDTAAFLRWLVARAYLTEFQAGLIARGRADRFFLGDYKLLDRIGQGRLARLYRAVHRLGQVVAIKVLSSTHAKDPAAVTRFQQEARLAMRLRHPNIVRVFQLSETGGRPFLVMEYLDGETLREVLQRRGRLPPEEAVRLVYQALLGLQHIHEQGGHHRDLNSANLILVPSGAKKPPDTTPRATVKIIDSHLEQALAEDGAESENPAPSRTGALPGRSDYLAPEQARQADKADIRADIYSLGCILYHALAGQPPFPDTNPINQMIRHAQETPRPLREFSAAVPDGLQQIVNWMMAKDPAQRYPTPERAAQALQVFLAAGTELATTAEAEPHLRSYLTWLESEEHGSTASQSRKSGHGHHVRKAKHAPRTTTLAQPSPAPEPEPAWDVELVPAPAFQETALTLKGLVLTRRDLLMLGIGAGTAATAGLIAFAVMQWRGHAEKGGAAGDGEVPNPSDESKK